MFITLCQLDWGAHAVRAAVHGYLMRSEMGPSVRGAVFIRQPSIRPSLAGIIGSSRSRVNTSSQLSIVAALSSGASLERVWEGS